MPICPITKKCEFNIHCTRYKNTHVFVAICAPLAQGAKILIWDLSSAYMSAKFYQDLLRFAGIIRK